MATPESENYLLNIARHGTAAHVEGLVRRFERVEALEDANTSHGNRAFNCFTDDDGSFVFHGRLTAEQGALLRKALGSAQEALWDDSRPGDTGDVSAETPAGQSHRNNRADALALVAESFLASGARESTGGDKYQVVIHKEDDNAHLEDGPGVSAETFERLACDCSVVEMQEDAASNPLNIGRKSRSIPPAMRRALKCRDGGCRFPGCTATRFVDGHHIQHWSAGGETRMDNLVLLCRHHHRLVHEGGFECLRMLDGKLRFTTPAGAEIPNVFVMPPSMNQGNLPPVYHDGRPGWRGDRIDWQLAIDGLSRASRKARAELCPG